MPESLFAAIEPFPMGLIAWVAIGLICALLSRLVMRGGRFGVFGDLVFGVMGALVASVPIGFLFRNTEGFAGSMLVAFVGSCVCIALGRVILSSPRPG